MDSISLPFTIMFILGVASMISSIPGIGPALAVVFLILATIGIIWLLRWMYFSPKTNSQS